MVAWIRIVRRKRVEAIRKEIWEQQKGEKLDKLLAQFEKNGGNSLADRIGQVEGQIKSVLSDVRIVEQVNRDQTNILIAMLDEMKIAPELANEARRTLVKLTNATTRRN